VGRRHAGGLLAVILAWSLGTAGAVSAHHNDGGSADAGIQSAKSVTEAMLDHHGGLEGHLPPSVKNLRLVSRLQLTQQPSGIADVGYFKGFAYLAAWAPECPSNGGTGGGVHIVDVRNPNNPTKVGFISSGPNEHPGEGIHLMSVDTPSFKGDLLLFNNEVCDFAAPSTLGMQIWNVTNPANPVKLSAFGDATPPSDPNLTQDSTYHSIHSVQGFTQPGKAFAVIVDNDEVFLGGLKDVDIVDITNPAAPVMATEESLEDWPGAQGAYANGDTVFHHDLQFKRIGGNDLLAVSYWDAGQVVLNVNDPYNPVFVGDSNFLTPDPETGFPFSEGNSHEGYWSSNNKFFISSDEDFSPFRTSFEITSGPNAGAYPAGEFGWTVPIASQPGGEITGSTIFGGRGCISGSGDPIPGEPVPQTAAQSGADTIVFSRGGCFFSTKVESGQNLGYTNVIVGQSHGATRGGLLVDGFFCGGQGHDFTVTASAVCIGHRAMHLIFSDTPEYTGPEGGDIPLNTLGADYLATPAFDSWGYINLHDATNPDLPIIDTHALVEQLHPGYSSGFGTLSVHEVKTDPRPNVNIAYVSWYNAGLRVVEFGPKGMEEVGHYIGPDGNDFWGVFPIGDETAGHGYSSKGPYEAPLILASDRDYGLYILRYTGSAGKCGGKEVTALGTSGKDKIKGTKGKDVINALGGNDKVSGLGGNDRLCGGKGKDTLNGAGGKDKLNGGPQRDSCVGGGGKDEAKACENEQKI
jgi:hypothetical protein